MVHMWSARSAKGPAQGHSASGTVADHWRPFPRTIAGPRGLDRRAQVNGARRPRVAGRGRNRGEGHRRGLPFVHGRLPRCRIGRRSWRGSEAELKSTTPLSIMDY